MTDFVQQNLIMIFRIILACICGVAIGYERKNRAKEAGIRTHCIVACASALMMIISKYGFMDFFQQELFAGDVRLDPSRMAQGIVTGVGFLGSGMIYVQRGSTKGLTTAAGIWATSGIGMALGAGMYVIGIISTGIVLAVQFIFHFKTSFVISHRAKALSVEGVAEEGYEERIISMLSEMNVTVTDVSVAKNSDGVFNYIFYIDVLETVNEEMLLRQFEYPCSISIAE